MKLDDETLIAFLDGELPDGEMERIAAILDDDPALAEQLERLQASDTAVRDAYQPIVDAPVPDALIAAVRGSNTSASPDQATLLQFRRPRRSPSLAGRPAWQAWGAIAASLVLGVLIGARLFGNSTDILHHDGHQLVASGALAIALETQPSQASGSGATQIQLSFPAAGGGYCRTFQHSGTAGLACREDGRWIVEMTAPAEVGDAGPIRTASTALPPALLDRVDARSAGETLGPDAEAAILRNGWSNGD